MDAVRESWTDERLDDFRAETARRLDTLDRRMDDGFDRVDAKFDEVDKRFDKVDERFERLEAKFDKKFDRFEARMDDLYRAILFMGGGAIVTFVVGLAGLIATS
jgi:archaellum component FlaC